MWPFNTSWWPFKTRKRIRDSPQQNAHIQLYHQHKYNKAKSKVRKNFTNARSTRQKTIQKEASNSHNRKRKAKTRKMMNNPSYIPKYIPKKSIRYAPDPSIIPIQNTIPYKWLNRTKRGNRIKLATLSRQPDPPPSYRVPKIKKYTGTIRKPRTNSRKVFSEAHRIPIVEEASPLYSRPSSKRTLSNEDESPPLIKSFKPLNSLLIKPKEPSPKEPSPKEPSPKKASPKKASPKKASPKEPSPKKASPKEPSPKKASPKKESPHAGVGFGKSSINRSTAIERASAAPDYSKPNPDFMPVVDNDPKCKYYIKQIATKITNYIKSHTFDTDKANAFTLTKKLMDTIILPEIYTAYGIYPVARPFIHRKIWGWGIISTLKSAPKETQDIISDVEKILPVINDLCKHKIYNQYLIRDTIIYKLLSSIQNRLGERLSQADPQIMTNIEQGLQYYMDRIFGHSLEC